MHIKRLRDEVRAVYMPILKKGYDEIFKDFVIALLFH